MKKNPTLVLLLLVAMVLSLVGCAASAPQKDSDYVSPPMEAERGIAPETDAGARGPGFGGEEGIPSATNLERKIIYSVVLNLIVKDTEEAFAQVQSVTQEVGGFVATSNMWRDEGHPRASVTVRVPADKLEDALARFRELAVDVESEKVDSQDVTEEYVDLEARLKNEQRTEAELLELLESRSQIGRTEDILEVHRELGQVRARIEQIQGRMKYLENLSAMATVRIELTPDALVQPIVVGGWQPQGTARNAIRMLLRTLQFFADAAIFVLLFVVPVLIVIAIPLAVLYWIARSLSRRARQRRAKST